MRTAELTLPGFRHDVCSAIHPGAVGSPFLRSLPLEEHGLEWIHPPAPLAHPFDDGTAVLLERSVAATADGLGEDGGAYRRLFEPLVGVADDLTDLLLAPLRRPRHLRAAARLAANAAPSRDHARQAAVRAASRARALFAGLAAHSILPLSRPPSGAVGLALGLFGHAFGWPLPRGGSQAIADALASYLRSLGAEIRCGSRVESLAELPRRAHRPAGRHAAPVPRSRRRRAALPLPSAAGRLPVRPRRLQARPRARRVDSLGGGRVQSGGDRPPRRHARRDRRCRGPGRAVGSIRSARSSCSPSRACSTPLGLRAASTPSGRIATSPTGRPSTWPTASRRRSSASPPVSVSGSSPVTRSARPGSSATTPTTSAATSPAGSQDLRQLFTRPVARLVPYSTPVRGVYLCSSSTPPGAGVHGMCGFHAARAALRGW